VFTKCKTKKNLKKINNHLRGPAPSPFWTNQVRVCEEPGAKLADAEPAFKFAPLPQTFLLFNLPILLVSGLGETRRPCAVTMETMTEKTRVVSERMLRCMFVD
jgi:hypothetical protein